MRELPSQTQVMTGMYELIKALIIISTGDSVSVVDYTMGGGGFSNM